MPEPRPLSTMQYGEFSRQAYDRAVQQDRSIKAQLELNSPYCMVARGLGSGMVHRGLDLLRYRGRFPRAAVGRQHFEEALSK